MPPRPPRRQSRERDTRFGIQRSDQYYFEIQGAGSYQTPVTSERYRSKNSKAEPAVAGNAYRGPDTDASGAVLFQQIATDVFGEVLAGEPVEQAVRETHLRAVRIYQEFGLPGR